MKRLRSLHSTCSLVKIDNLTTEELYLIVTLLADKYLTDEGEDEQLFNSDLTELSNISIERINLIERQVLIALNWNLYISNDEFRQFHSQIVKRLNKNIENDILRRFYSIYLKFLPHTIEYLALTSLILLGSTLSILTAIHIGTLTHSTLMKTFNPTIDCSQSSICYWNNLTKEIINDFNLETYPWITNETTEENYVFDLSPNVLSSPLSISDASCSIDMIRFPRSMVESIG
jgi:hypothetical protein